MPSVDRRAFLQTAIGSVATLAIGTSADGMPLPNMPPTPAWIRDVTRMTFGSAADLPRAKAAGVQVLHTNLVWPYYPLQKDGGELSKDDDRKLRELVAACKQHGIRLALGLPPFPPASLVRARPDWRIHPDDTGKVLTIEPRDDDLGTRLACNLGPWGDYLIELCHELVRDYGIDALSFDGNYHPALCHCPACKMAYRDDRQRALPARANLDDVAYREYLLWRGERLEQHYAKLVHRIREASPDAALMTWTVNAGRHGHFLHSPRAMPTRLNRLIDLPMQEWWLDETNVGASVAPTFGAAYLRATTGRRPAAAEPYLMSHGNPYGTDSFPAHERLTRTLLAVTNGCVAAESMGWPGHGASAANSLREVGKRAPWLTNVTPLPWAALLVSEQTRQFYAYKSVADHFLPHVFGAFRAGMEEHLPLTLVNDWDVTAEALGKYKVVMLPNAAALTSEQALALRRFVETGGGLVATGETSLCDDLGRAGGDFALADLFGVHYAGRPKAPLDRPKLDANFAVSIDDAYWKQRTGVASLVWQEHPLLEDDKLRGLVPTRRVTFRGPMVRVTEPTDAQVVVRMALEGSAENPLPAMVARRFGQGRVVYLAACIDAALWSYAYPYQRRLLAHAIRWAAGTPPPIEVQAPMSVQTTFYHQTDPQGTRIIIHLFNGLNTTAHHGHPATDVPLREEIIPIHDVEVRLRHPQLPMPKSVHWEPDGEALKFATTEKQTTILVPRLELHGMVVVEETGA